MRINCWLILILMLTMAPGAMAQKRFELTPFAVFPFGGEFESDDEFDFFDFDIDDGSGYGLSLGFPLSRNFQIELFWSHQESDLTAESDLFFGDFTITDIDIDYYHAGVLYQFGPGQFRPFIAASVGVTELDPGDPLLESESRFSLGVGAGAKIYFSQHFGLRLEARAFTTVIDEGDDFCDRDRRRDCFYDDGTYFLQAELRGGLLFAF